MEICFVCRDTGSYLLTVCSETCKVMVHQICLIKYIKNTNNKVKKYVHEENKCYTFSYVKCPFCKKENLVSKVMINSNNEDYHLRRHYFLNLITNLTDNNKKESEEIDDNIEKTIGFLKKSSHVFKVSL